MAYVYLSIAIVAEVVAISALKASEGFTVLWPSIICVVGYAVALYLLSLSLKEILVGIAYAIWAGMGIALIAVVSAVLFKQIPDLPAIVGMMLIASGVATIQLFSKTVSH
jgi:small multidrug resistance pump